MKDLGALVALYTEIDRSFETELITAAAFGDLIAAERLMAKQRFNDQAYFVICWGQMEAEIDEACRGAIRARRAKLDWLERRCRDIFDPEDKRLSGLSFDGRAAIVLDKNGGPGSPWANSTIPSATRSLTASCGPVVSMS